jgi:hypothetical protein
MGIIAVGGEDGGEFRDKVGVFDEEGPRDGHEVVFAGLDEDDLGGGDVV